jgi:exosortase/archaeosortase family protein
MIKTQDCLIIALLAVYAIFIWTRDTSWMTSSDDTLPILVALPLFWWLGKPWLFLEISKPISTNKIVFCFLLFLIGSGINSTLILTLSWTLALWSWLSVRLPLNQLPSIKKMLILPLMSFPWISMDANQIGWWFRLSGAWMAAHFFSLFGADVDRQGTLMVVNGIPISVEVACAGLNTLQSMLIAGSVVAFIFLGDSNRYWWNLPLLVLISWLANTLRIIVITLAALLVSRQFASGTFHELGGWVVIMLMFGFCSVLFYLQKPSETKNTL